MIIVSVVFIKNISIVGPEHDKEDVCVRRVQASKYFTT